MMNFLSIGVVAKDLVATFVLAMYYETPKLFLQLGYKILYAVFVLIV